MKRTVKITLTIEQANCLKWLLRHTGFSEALATTPPHLNIEKRKEKSYAMMHAASAVEGQLEEANVFGNDWMYTS